MQARIMCNAGVQRARRAGTGSALQPASNEQRKNRRACNTQWEHRMSANENRGRTLHGRYRQHAPQMGGEMTPRATAGG